MIVLEPPTRARDSIRAGESLNPLQFNQVRSQLILNHCKWDPQVGDVPTLASFPLILTQSQWQQLSADAEALTAEALAAEQELLENPKSQSTLGIPRSVRRLLAPSKPTDQALPRILRFDFHFTKDGWQISEVNADVPGGWCESSAFPRLMLDHYPGTTTAGDPAAQWADSIANVAAEHGRDIALLTAPGYMEDHQVMAYLAQELQARGFVCHLSNPSNLIWKNGVAHLHTDFGAPSLGAVVRFVQAEWLPNQPRNSTWQNFFLNQQTPVLNPARSILIESKGFPLVWNQLKTPLPTWQRLLPQTADPRDVDWQNDDTWLLKTTFCNNGDTVTIRDSTPEKAWRRARFNARWNPRHWIAQRRFQVLPVDSPLGPVFPCIGVYTVNGQAAGIYGRISRNPVINYSAIDIAVLVEESH